MTTLLIDGDLLLYKVAAIAAKTLQLRDEGVSSADKQNAQRRLEDRLTRLSEKLGPKNRVIALGDSNNWLKAIYPDYKLKRAKTPKPIMLEPLKEFLIARGETCVRPGLEADDVLGILATSQQIKGKKIIVSSDKDLMQIPGLHYNPDKPWNGVVEVDADEGELFHLMQTLHGDAVDGYPGCRGVGPEKAKAVLDGHPIGSRAAWNAIVAEYQRRGSTEHHALIQARIARILRATDYDFATGTVHHWNPPLSESAKRNPNMMNPVKMGGPQSRDWLASNAERGSSRSEERPSLKVHNQTAKPVSAANLTPPRPTPTPPPGIQLPPGPKPDLIRLSSLEPGAAARLTAARNLLEAQRQHDLQALLACFGPEPTVEFAGGPRHIGAEQIGLIYRDLLRAFPDLALDVLAEHVANRSVIMEFVMQGTHHEQWLGMAPLGRTLTLPVANSFLFDRHDQISALRIYLDRNLAIVQLTSGLLR